MKNPEQKKSTKNVSFKDIQTDKMRGEERAKCHLSGGLMEEDTNDGSDDIFVERTKDYESKIGNDKSTQVTSAKEFEPRNKNLWSKDLSKLFISKGSDVISVLDDNDRFEISFNTSEYRPDELRVNVGEGILSVEGKHEEKFSDGRRRMFKKFSWKYNLPETIDPEKIISNLSHDGVLVITAPKMQCVKLEPKIVPIIVL